MTDIGPQGSSLAQNSDLSCDSESRVPGGFPVPTIRGHTSALKTSPLADHDDGVPTILQDLSGFKHATEYFVYLTIQRLRNVSPCPGHFVLALGKIRNELSNIWSSFGKFVHVDGNTLTAAVVIM